MCTGLPIATPVPGLLGTDAQVVSPPRMNRQQSSILYVFPRAIALTCFYHESDPQSDFVTWKLWFTGVAAV